MPKPEVVTRGLGEIDEVLIPSAVYMGAEGRYEDYVYLSMIESEWLKPLTDSDRFLAFSEPKRPSARAIIVVVFWAYFETRIERILRASLRGVPSQVTDDLLGRYSSIGSRMDRLYQVLFSTTYQKDLQDLGYRGVASLLVRLQRCRNDFAHGKPEAINDSLVEDLVGGLKDEHEAWIAIFNKRLKAGLTSVP